MAKKRKPDQPIGSKPTAAQKGALLKERGSLTPLNLSDFFAERKNANPFHVEIPEEMTGALEEFVTQLGGFQSIVAAHIKQPFSLLGRLGLNNILGVYIGRKFEEHQPTPKLCIKVMVRRKTVNLSFIDSAARIPSFLPFGKKRFQTDIEEAEPMRAQPGTPHDPVYGKRETRARAGGSIGHPKTTAGTFGALCLVDEDQFPGGLLCALSNNHVLAAVNDATDIDGLVQAGARVDNDTADRADLSYHPGLADVGNNPASAIGFGSLYRFANINLSNNQHVGPSNTIDAAVTWVATKLVDGRHHNFTIDPVADVWSDGMAVIKEGRTTGFTEGRIVGQQAKFVASYDLPSGQRVFGHFTNQVLIQGNQGRFSDAGDSGSVICNQLNKRPVGLLFAGTNPNQFGVSYTAMNPIQPVMEALRISRFYVA